MKVKWMIAKKKGEWLELIIPKEWDGYSIEYILKEIWQVPKSLFHQYRTGQGVKVNGDVYPYSRELHAGERFQIHLFPKEDYGVIPNFLEADILYEDDHLLIVNKPSGMDTHPNEEGQTDTLANAVAYHFLINGIETKVRHIHRLDKDTTGAVLFAKHALSGAILDQLLEKRAINRTYLALVHGRILKKKGTINEPIGRDRHHPTKRRVSPTGQEAITDYEVLEYDSKRNMTLVKLQLHTGRTHQIRVHMSHIGYPLAGDKLYGVTETRYPRQALHAVKISLPHPIFNQDIHVIAPFLDQPPIFTYDPMKL